MAQSKGRRPSKRASKPKQRSRQLDPNEQINRAVEHIKPPPAFLEDCRAEVAYRLALWGFDGATWSALTALKPKEMRKAATSFLAALERVRATAQAFPPGEMFGYALEEWTHELAPLIDRFVGRCRAIIATKAGPPRRNADKQRWAAETALMLMLRYHRIEKLTAKGVSRVAADLYGDQNTDLIRYCRATIHRWKKPGAK